MLFGTGVLLAVIIMVAGSRLSRLTNANAISSTEPVDLYLKESVELPQLADMLADSGVIRDKEELIWAAKLLGWRNFSSGHYQVDGGYSYDLFLSRMARGIQDPVSLTIIPGTTEERLVERLTDTFKFDSLSIRKAMDDSTLLAQYRIERKDLIGRMLPNTYSLYWTLSPHAVLKRIFNEFEKSVIDPYRMTLKEMDKSVNEVVTLASIIEWEASAGDDRSKISGVYWNRLDRGMRLQADPTVNFAIDERRRLLYEDYNIDHPYNTYIYRGLPPGPITNPSLESIEAAMYPDSHDFLYMVASPEGHHVYSETFEEHKKESAKWRRWIREQYRIKRMREKSDSIESNTNSNP